MLIYMMRIGVDRIGERERKRTPSVAPRASDLCPDDGERGVFRGPALVCPRCGRFLGGL